MWGILGCWTWCPVLVQRWHPLQLGHHQSTETYKSYLHASSFYPLKFTEKKKKIFGRFIMKRGDNLIFLFQWINVACVLVYLWIPIIKQNMVINEFKNVKVKSNPTTVNITLSSNRFQHSFIKCSIL